VQELLGETLEELQAGRMKPGQAYATGYLAQLMLAAQAARRKEYKIDVKNFWEIVDLVLAFDDAKKSLKEKARKAREEKRAKEAREAEERQEADEADEADETEDAESCASLGEADGDEGYESGRETT
jgi:hypothetical protein